MPLRPSVNTLLKLLLYCTLALLSLGCANEKVNRVLVFSKNSQNQLTADEAATALAAYVSSNNIEVDTTTNPAYFVEDSLKRYGTVVFLSTSQDVLAVRHQNEIERFVQAGGGFVGVHAAGSSRYQWPWYNSMLGASFEKQPDSLVSVVDVQMQLVGEDKMLTEGLSKSWQQQDAPFKLASFDPGATVLVESEQGEPISWYRAYDGGRTFYTIAGGTTESYENEDFLRHVLGGIRYTLQGPELDYGKAYTQQVPEDNRFLPVVLDTYLHEPIEMEVMSDGRVLFIERLGNVKLYDPEQKETRVLAKLDVHTEGNYEDGLLGLELDPDFDRNNYIYLYYSPVGDKAVQNLSRFKLLGGDSLIMRSEKVVLEVPVQRETCCHSAGNVYFGPDGYLYLTTGDNTSSKESDGFTPIDERPGRAPFDAQKSSGNTHDLRGKILRIKVNPDGTYAIPDGNLFPKDGSEGRPEIYVMGARNPYRMTVDKRGYVYWGDVGPDGGIATERGPLSQDEWNQARRPGNYGWPYFVGDNKAYADFNFATNEVGPKFNPRRPVNESPNNYGSRVLPPAQNAMIWYPYGESEEFPMLGTGSRSAMAGPFYYFGDYQKSRSKFPKYYDNKMFIYEWARDWMKVLTFDEKGNLQKIEPFLPSQEFAHPIDVKFGRDGAMYVLQYGANYFARNPDASLIRIEYAEGNRQPVAQIEAEKTVGAAPFKVTLSGKKSFDYDKGDALRYTWESGAGEESEEASPTFTYSKPGVYRPKLTVTDKEGDKATAELELKVGNDVPQVTIAMAGNRSFYFDNRTLNYRVQVQDKEDGQLYKGIPANQVNFSVDYLPEGKDLALLTSNSQNAEAGSVKFLRGKTLIAGSDCKSCHAIDKKSIGPTYKAIAARYAGKKGAVPQLVKKIIAGGNGNWGTAMMAAHPQLSEEETTAMVQYILSLTDGAQASLPLAGTYPLKEHKGVGEAGSYVISASYTDTGDKITGPLTGRELVVLRHPRVQAEDFDSFRNVGRQQPHGDGPSVISDIKDGSYISFKNIDLTGIKELVFQVASGTDGGTIEVRAGSPTGKLVGTANVNPGIDNSSWREWKTVTAPVINNPGETDELFFVFRNKVAKDRAFMLLDWIYFYDGAGQGVATK
ncbi:cytochrome c [Pontibacter ummariensis]|uniref:Cytochrome c n=1 Tax=Pontibacter ummariensis TaxID=1610492 RepID=A0A239BAZ9_9BACT|nr:ThuA domain-containing protein [Pontibacter ummariensis]PRY16382.1 cytochrome c [Pontibacter ummariensis]SNS04183.1 cytochrome c [Pontibacter ummariensis]